MAQLPDDAIQETAADVVKDVIEGKCEAEDIWIKLNGRYHTLRVTCARGTPVFESKGGIDCTYDNSSRILITSLSDARTCFTLPLRSFAVLEGKACCGDANQAGQVVAGGMDGSLALYSSDGTLACLFDGHGVYTHVARFFPNGQVILSSGMDGLVKIWSAASGNPVRSLSYQKGPIVALDFVDRGRNILTCCQRDNSVALWDVGDNKVVRSLSVAAPRCVSVQSDINTDALSDDGPHEFGVSGQVAAIGGDTGVGIYDLRDRLPLQQIAAGRDTSSLAVAGHLLAYSCADGVRMIDIRNPKVCRTEFPLNPSSVGFGGTSLYCVGARSNRVFAWDIEDSTPTVVCTSFKTRALTTASIAGQQRLLTVGDEARVFSI